MVKKRTDADAKPPRSRDPERTKARILTAATDLFTRCGLNGASIDDISKRAGVNRGLIHHYFRSKESLFDQVLARPFAEYVESHLEFLHHREVDPDSIRQAVRSFFTFLGGQPTLVRLMGWTIAMRKITGDVTQLELTRALFDRAVQRMEDARAAGRIRNDIDPAQLLITIIDLSVAWHLGRLEWIAKLGWKEQSDQEIDARRLAAIEDLIGAAVTPHASQAPAASLPSPPSPSPAT